MYTYIYIYIYIYINIQATSPHHEADWRDPDTIELAPITDTDPVQNFEDSMKADPIHLDASNAEQSSSAGAACALSTGAACAPGAGADCSASP